MVYPVALGGYSANLLWSLDDYTANYEGKHGSAMWNVIATSFAAFLCLWIIDYSSRFIFRLAKFKLIKEEKHVIICGRHTMDCVAMGFISYAGYESILALGGFSGIAELVVDGRVLDIGAERIYHFSPAAQRLCMVQIAYEAKNFCDSVIHNDGAIFLAHHILTGLVTVVAANPFMHIYAGFYLGISEISTMVLCVLVCFDAERGIPGFPEAYPVIMTVLAGMFATLFIIFRMVLWLYVNYYFWVDLMHLFNNQYNVMHDSTSVIYVMFVNFSLTLLQFIWLKEIFDNAVSVLGLGGGPRARVAGGTTGGKAVKGEKTNTIDDAEPTPTRTQPRRNAKK